MVRPLSIAMARRTGWADGALVAWSYLWLALVLALLLPAVALGALLQRFGDPRRLRAGRWLRRGGALIGQGCPLWTFQITGALPRDGRAYVIVANHRSAVDILAISIVLSRAGWATRWLVKQELFQVPWIGWILRLARDIPVKRSEFKSRSNASKHSTETLAAGISVVIFPEGTRSLDGALGPFQPGAFQLAIDRGAPILPVALRGTERCFDGGGLRPLRAAVEVEILEAIETMEFGPSQVHRLMTQVSDRLALSVHRPWISAGEATPPKLDRRAIEAAVASGKRLLVQGAMGVMASDGLPGKIAKIQSERFLPVGTISAVAKPVSLILHQLERSRREAPRGFIGVNLMAAVNRDDFEATARASLQTGVSFLVQGAGISREILRWCREHKTPFGGIVSSGRLAALYERWGADFLVAEGREAGGHLGDPDASLDRILREVRSASSLPVIAAGGLADGADLGRAFAAGASGVQLATRFIVSTDCEVHPNFKLMHMGKTEADVVTITSTVKGMRARAIRNLFTERLTAGEVFPPKSKHRYYGSGGLRGRRKACDDCLAVGICTSRESGHTESFCISDALLRAAIDGDVDRGLFYTGQSVTRIRERSLDELRSVAEIVAELEQQLIQWQAANHGGSPQPGSSLESP